MAVTLANMVEVYGGAIGSYDVLPAANDGIMDVIKRYLQIRPDTFYDFATHVTFTDKYAIPATLGIDAVRNPIQDRKRCRYVHPTWKKSVIDTGSIHYATADSPVWTFVDDADGEADVIVPTTLTALTGSSIASFPSHLLYAWALFTAQGLTQLKISAAIEALIAESISDLTISTSFPTDIGSAAIAIPAVPDFIPATPTFPDMSSYFTVSTNFITNEWDESLASAKLQEIQTRLQDYMSELDGIMKEWNADITEYSKTNERYQVALSRYQADINKEVAQYQANLQAYSSTLQTLSAKIQTLFARLSSLREMYLACFPQPGVQK
jgi:hypothetical protein